MQYFGDVIYDALTRCYHLRKQQGSTIIRALLGYTMCCSTILSPIISVLVFCVCVVCCSAVRTQSYLLFLNRLSLQQMTVTCNYGQRLVSSEKRQNYILHIL
jgi:hypothetical protein